VAVQANPELRPERVPAEWELGASAAGALGGVDLRGGGSVYRSDVRGMIVWAPDFRFVWSPRNLDTRRDGAELWAEAEAPGLGLSLSGAYGMARITYDHPGRAHDGAQVMYRPRHTAWLRAAWARGPWRAEASAAFTGERYPNPGPVNALPGFWSLAGSAAREWRVGPAVVTTAVRADRLLDEKDALIFGYPEPGRRIRVDVAVRRAENP
jgi:iron complex outermembrane receptor protein